MSKVFVTADLHLGHRNICKYRKEFSSAEEHDKTILENIRSAVTKRDKLFILGDAAFTWERLLDLEKLPCTTILLLGNHDTDRSLTVEDLYLVFSEVHSLYKYKKAWLSHCPIHPDELRGRINIHGHCHYHKIDDPRYVNVCVENTNYYPVNYQEILNRS